jgi:hypothetical protein
MTLWLPHPQVCPACGTELRVGLTFPKPPPVGTVEHDPRCVDKSPHQYCTIEDGAK